jgi:hypothetical protein
MFGSVRGQLQLPVYCKPQVYYAPGSGGVGGRVDVIVGSKGGTPKPVENVVVRIPFPHGVTTVHLTATQGSVSFDEITKARRCHSVRRSRAVVVLLGVVVVMVAGDVFTARWSVLRFADCDVAGGQGVEQRDVAAALGHHHVAAGRTRAGRDALVAALVRGAVFRVRSAGRLVRHSQRNLQVLQGRQGPHASGRLRGASLTWRASGVQCDRNGHTLE